MTRVVKDDPEGLTQVWPRSNPILLVQQQAPANPLSDPWETDTWTLFP